MNKYVLDASAVLAMLQEETGHEIVEKALLNAIISAVNFSEIVAILIKHDTPPVIAQEVASDLVQEIIPFDENHAMIATE